MSEAASHSEGWRPATYYPDPAIHALDPRFEKYWLKLSAVERLATGLRWAEGPVWFGDGRYLLWSDIPNNRILKWDEETGAVSIYRKPSNFANGNTRDRQGRLVTCEHGGRRVTRTEYDGSITVLLDRFDGKRLNSPNDVVVKSDGSIWFTDPTFGILGNYEGYKAEPEICRPTSIGSTARPAKPRSWPTTCSARTACASRRTKRSSTSWNRAACRPARSSPTTWRATATRSPTSASSSMPVPARPTACAAISTAICGAAGAWAIPSSTASWSSRPTAIMIGRIALPERCANVCFGGLQAQPAVHGREPVDLRAVRQHAGRARGIATHHALPRWFNPSCPGQPRFAWRRSPRTPFPAWRHRR